MIRGSKELVALAYLVLLPDAALAQTRLEPGRAGNPNAALVSPGAAPFGSAISEERIPGYHRATHLIGTSGPLTRTGVIEAKRIGFVAILDLTTSPERSAAERRIAEFAHIAYFHLPIANLPAADELQKLAQTLQTPSNLPILVHGDSLDHVGAVWALLRAHQGVPGHVALIDGLTTGLSTSEPAVRERLGLPPS